jgi:outer membrane protein assembly factor BamD (BamD/ComL family)
MHPFRLTVLLVLLFSGFSAEAQLGFDLDIKKPEPYENRELKAERTPDKPIKGPKKLFQNATTHYNYFFNANVKLNEILDRAKEVHKDDYTKLLSFYNYSFETLARDSSLLDSVIAKSKTAIVLHDLRNSWIDDMYMLWGASYYLQRNFDSAYNMFQFINYAFADKEKDGYYRYIGSRMDGNNAMSVSTKETNSLAKRLLSEPPARNDAFIWQVRTMIQQDAYPEAGSLITTLKNDPLFPERLRSELEEVQALWFYKQGRWDSSAHHLVKALDVAKKGQERARWQYLAAQMFERTGVTEQAKIYYGKVVKETTDPVMEVYARLNLIRINKAGNDNADIDKNIAELLKMARRDKYADYRDVIYSMIARMELEKGDFMLAQGYLLKASKYKNDNPVANNEAYLQLADLSFAGRKYSQAASFYDSVKLTNLSAEDVDRVNNRRPLLASLVAFISTIERQDSLQRIAAMPEEERSAYVKRLVRQLRRQQGLKDEAAANASGIPATFDPFATATTKGEWYFYNDNLKKTGVATFRQVWGSRPNVDNWRRQSDVTAQLTKRITDNTRPGKATSGNLPADPFTYDAMMEGLPLTASLLQSSNDSIQRSLFGLGRLYMNDMEDYKASIETFEKIRSRFMPVNDLDQVLFNLYYSYTKTGNAAKAAEMKRLLLSQFPNGRYATIVNTGADPLSNQPTAVVTKTYEDIYDLFLEGKFAEAKAAKQKADSVYKTNYWSPQLLYIEAVAQVRQNDDSLAKKTLNTLIRQNAGTPLAAKAKTMIDVLGRRKQIEEELRNLQITRPAEDSLFVEPMPIAAPVKKKTEVVLQPKDTAVVVKKPVPVKATVDTLPKKAPPIVQKPNSPYSFKPDSSHFAVVVLNKVDVVFVNEAKNAFLRYTAGFSDRPLQATIVPVNDDIKLLLIGNFVSATSAIGYVQKVKPIASTQVVPWLKGDKYTFSIISAENLKAVLTAKEIAAYQKFLEETLPVKL